MVRVTISKGGGLAGEKALPHRALTWADADDANFVDGILSVYHGDKRLAVPGQWFPGLHRAQDRLL